MTTFKIIKQPRFKPPKSSNCTTFTHILTAMAGTLAKYLSSSTKTCSPVVTYLSRPSKIFVKLCQNTCRAVVVSIRGLGGAGSHQRRAHTSPSPSRTRWSWPRWLCLSNLTNWIFRETMKSHVFAVHGSKHIKHCQRHNGPRILSPY